MPERPDLDYVVPILNRDLRGAEITGLRLRKPVVLRQLIEGDPGSLVSGHAFEITERRGPFVVFTLREHVIEVAVNPMLAGRFVITMAAQRESADMALSLSLRDGRELRYRDDVQMGKVYIYRPEQRHQVPALGKIGVDVLDRRAFTFECFRELARQRRDQVKVFLLDKGALDSLGNAYADEVLWEARVHPKTMVRKLSDEQLRTLHQAIPAVLERAADEISRRQPATDEKLRDFLNVRGRAGDPCKRCGAKLRRARVRADDAIFCPRCQVDERGSAIVDWRRVS